MIGKAFSSFLKAYFCQASGYLHVASRFAACEKRKHLLVILVHGPFVAQLLVKLAPLPVQLSVRLVLLDGFDL